jgi:hypothetical protein
LRISESDFPVSHVGVLANVSARLRRDGFFMQARVGRVKRSGMLVMRDWRAAAVHICVSILTMIEWYCALYGEARDSFPSLPQGLSIRNDSNETSAGVIWSSSSAQATDWCQSCRAWVLLRRHDAVLGRDYEREQAKST